jgi:hypothetical protein
VASAAQAKSCKAERGAGKKCAAVSAQAECLHRRSLACFPCHFLQSLLAMAAKCPSSAPPAKE